MARVLITGSNSGIGLELARQFAERGDEVVATCRVSSADLSALGVRVMEDVDVTSDASIRALGLALAGRRLDILVNNAGVLTEETLDALDFERMRRQFEVNALGPLRVTAALLPNLHRGAKVVIVTSRAGSLGDNTSGGLYGYRVSKAAVNMIGINLAHDVRGRGIAVALLHPGSVATGLNRGRGMPPADAARGLLTAIDRLTLAESGWFTRSDGTRLPW
jgi:NAD(P)-dependent dehydrogenase (short-subunit alcohol dehydrogenase family)